MVLNSEGIELVDTSLIIGEDCNLLKELETNFIQLACDWGFKKEIIFPTMTPLNIYNSYKDEFKDLIVSVELNDGYEYAVTPEYRTIAKYELSDFKNYAFFNTGKTVSYTDKHNINIKEDYVICVHYMNPENRTSAFVSAMRWMMGCGKEFDSTNKFTPIKENLKSVRFKYNNTTVGYVYGEDDYVHAVISLSELIKIVNNG